MKKLDSYGTSIKTYWEEKLMVGYLPPPIVQVNLEKVHPMHLRGWKIFLVKLILPSVLTHIIYSASFGEGSTVVWRLPGVKGYIRFNFFWLTKRLSCPVSSGKSFCEVYLMFMGKLLQFFTTPVKKRVSFYFWGFSTLSAQFYFKLTFGKAATTLSAPDDPLSTFIFA